jgi:O-antigen ligase
MPGASIFAVLVVSVRSRAAAVRLDSALATRGAWWLLALPLLFLHVRYQPSVTVSLGSTRVEIDASDLVVAVGLVVAFASGLPARLTRRSWLALGPAAVLMVVIAAGTAHGAASLHGYATATHAVTALKYAEYAVLALVIVALVRGRTELLLLCGVVTAWSVVCTVDAILQFVGLVPEFEGIRPLQREVSLVGLHDFAALSGAALAIALTALALGTASRRETYGAWAAGVSGVLGVALSGSSAGLIGVVAAAAATALVAQQRGRLDRSRIAALAACVVVVGGGVVALRSTDITQFFRWAGVAPRKASTTENVQTYAQRSIVAYIALRMWLDHPLVGTGWQGALEPAGYGPYLEPARKRFPAQPAEAFPSPAHPTNPQNLYVQLLSDLGLAGLIAFLATLLGSAWLAFGAMRRKGDAAAAGLLALLWMVVAAGVANAIGLVAGIPLEALIWLAVGLAVAADRMDR